MYFAGQSAANKFSAKFGRQITAPFVVKPLGGEHVMPTNTGQWIDKLIRLIDMLVSLWDKPAKAGTTNGAVKLHCWALQR